MWELSDEIYHDIIQHDDYIRHRPKTQNERIISRLAKKIPDVLPRVSDVRLVFDDLADDYNHLITQWQEFKTSVENDPDFVDMIGKDTSSTGNIGNLTRHRLNQIIHWMQIAITGDVDYYKRSLRPIASKSSKKNLILKRIPRSNIKVKCINGTPRLYYKKVIKYREYTINKKGKKKWTTKTRLSENEYIVPKKNRVGQKLYTIIDDALVKCDNKLTREMRCLKQGWSSFNPSDEDLQNCKNDVFDQVLKDMIPLLQKQFDAVLTPKQFENKLYDLIARKLKSCYKANYCATNPEIVTVGKCRKLLKTVMNLIAEMKLKAPTYLSKYAKQLKPSSATNKIPPKVLSGSQLERLQDKYATLLGIKHKRTHYKNVKIPTRFLTKHSKINKRMKQKYKKWQASVKTKPPPN